MRKSLIIELVKQCEDSQLLALIYSLLITNKN